MEEKVENYYTTLGVCLNASTEDVKKAYRHCVLIAHPDKNYGNEKAHGVFIKVCLNDDYYWFPLSLSLFFAF